jgi:hypothetical protein
VRLEGVPHALLFNRTYRLLTVKRALNAAPETTLETRVRLLTTQHSGEDG